MFGTDLEADGVRCKIRTEKNKLLSFAPISPYFGPYAALLEENHQLHSQMRAGKDDILVKRGARPKIGTEKAPCCKFYCHRSRNNCWSNNSRGLKLNSKLKNKIGRRRKKTKKSRSNNKKMTFPYE